MTIEFDGQNNKLGTTTANSVTIKTNDTDAITIDSSQNVGIGVVPQTWYTTIDALQIGLGGSLAGNTVNPSRTYLSANAYVNASNQETYIATDEASQYFQNAGTHIFKVASSGTAGTAISFTEAMKIDNSGNLLVGKTSSGAGNRGVEFTNLTVANPRQTITSTGTGTETKIEFRNGNGYVGEIYTNGSSTVYLTSSDYRLKENVVDLTSATDRLKQLQPKRFNFIADADTTVDGFLAHEVSSIVPEAISGEKDAMRTEEYEVTPAELDEEGNIITEAVMGTREVPDYQGIDQSKLVPLLTASLKEAIAKIEELETRLEALENV